ncbi:hypothetical protein Tco_0660279 [Tanacetum coccineum]
MEKRIAEEQAAKDRYWKIPICYDDDEDDTIAITPVLPIEEPDNSLSMGDEHLDTIPATESDEDIDYVDASPPDVEIVSLEVVEIVDPEVERIDDDILSTIKDDTLREKLLNVNLLVAKIDALRDNPTPSSDVVTNFLLPIGVTLIMRVFADELTHIMPLPELECFKFKIEPDPGDLDSIDLGIRKNVSTTNVNVPLEDDQSSLFAYVDCPDCDDSRAPPSFCPPITRASHPQLHFGNPVSKSNRLTF